MNTSDSTEIHQYRLNPTPEEAAAALQADWERDVQRTEMEEAAFHTDLERDARIQARRQEKAALALQLDRQRDELDREIRKAKRERWEAQTAKAKENVKAKRAKRAEAERVKEVDRFTQVFGVVKWEGNATRQSAQVLGQTVVATLHPAGGYVVQVGAFDVPGIFTTTTGFIGAIQTGLIAIGAEPTHQKKRPLPKVAFPNINHPTIQ